MSRFHESDSGILVKFSDAAEERNCDKQKVLTFLCS